MTTEQIPDQFFIDVAVGVVAFEDLCSIHDVDPEIDTDDELFVKRLRAAQQAVEDDGRAFRARCRTLVQRNIHSMERLMLDLDAPASTRLETFKALVKYGDLEPEKTREQDNTGPQLVFNIIAPDGSIGYSNRPVIEHASPMPSSPSLPTDAPVALEAFF